MTKSNTAKIRPPCFYCRYTISHVKNRVEIGDSGSYACKACADWMFDDTGLDVTELLFPGMVTMNDWRFSIVSPLVLLAIEGED